MTHRDARWFPEPTRFDPERFLPGRVETIPAHAWFPFGGGPRVCYSRAMRWVLTLVLALAAACGHEAEKQSVEMKAATIVGKDKGMSDIKVAPST